MMEEGDMRKAPEKDNLIHETGSAMPDMAAAQPGVLLVEDDLSARWLMRNALKGRCVLLSATTGEEALALYLRHRPEIVVLDYCLPQQKGDTVLRMLLDADPAVHVVAMSSRENQAALDAMLAAGAQAVLVKPFTKDEFLCRVLSGAPFDTFFDQGN